MERLLKLGKVEVKASKDVKSSRLGLGFEKLDRDVFDPEKAYDKVAQLGIKWIRIQSGWQRTEKTKGIYDFDWIDKIVNNLLERGLKPWICLCYGNGLYTEAARKEFGAVGCPPIHSAEEKLAWNNYVRETAAHFKGRVEYYEVWNEPDGKWCWKHGVSGIEYGNFVIDTAKSLRSGDATAKVIGGSIYSRELKFLNTAFKTGMGEHIDAITFHEYTAREELVFERVAALRGLCNEYNPQIKIIQGESGSQSRSNGNGALKTGAWTQKKQAKQLLRHTLSDLITEVEFTSYFSCLDMIEALNGKVDDKSSYMDYGYFGVLGADFDDNGFATGDYTPKLSYIALQTIASVFAEEFKVCDLPVIFTPRESPRIFSKDFDGFSIIRGGFKRNNGASAFVYWNSTDLMTTEFESTVTIQVAAQDPRIRLIDLLDGSIYEIPSSMIESEDGCHVLKNIPIKDYPLLLTFGEF
jgi:hypothetical protein